MSLRPAIALALLAAACGHGPEFPEYNDGGTGSSGSSGGSSSSGSSGTQPPPPPPAGGKPCDFADGKCACFVEQGDRGCCIGSSSKLQSETSPAGARIFDPSDPNGAIDNVDVSCKSTQCHPMSGAEGVLVICPSAPKVSCGCN